MGETAETLSHEQRIQLLEFENKTNAEAHKEFFDRIRKLEISDARQIEQYNAIIKEISGLSTSINTLTKKLSDIEAKPGKRWDGLVDKAVWAVCAAVIAFFLAKLGLPG